MQQLNLPSYPFKIKTEQGKPFIFCSLRKKYVALTPEEWVRQHFAEFLFEKKDFPKSLTIHEHSISLNNTKKRCDTVAFLSSGKPVVIVEYKAPSVNITQQVFDQIARYNIKLRVKYLIVSNGLQHYCCRVDYDTMSYEFLADIPAYKEL
ncbi:MAG: type I restriction enzyme HsdR N-terminal domain-containing protein [Prevotellaceae bacterium]|jgi:hypothetical protein|nr:type I restriction enzyme HsdR N-terminal domain-containing protein [Prevotellaceae bacterium]